ncbi:MAG TPA: penicillin-binding transpeptidase domain-containing protein, partial [Prolixibacteraceae bacterium]|nr:penicillin-binding transpeptidase domain-containing protein [Prolixibacteraceae bacterium]
DPTYKEYATNNVLRKVVQYPARGLVYDRNGELLVYNQAAYDLLVTPREVVRFDTLTLCSLVDITIEEFRQKFQEARAYSSYKPSVIVKQISPEKYAVLQEHLYKLKGFYIQPRTLRQYPKPLAAHVLGYVGEVTRDITANDPYYQSGDYIGISGIEKTYEKELRGKKGVKYFLVDVHNRMQGSYLDGRADSAAQIGKNLVLTIDARLQEYAEQLMKNKKGSIVAIDPATGEVLAMVSTPNYDPNLLVGRQRGNNYAALAADSLKPLFNRSLMAQYPPGSTFKMANALVALQEGVITPYTEYYCAHGYHVGNFTVGCHHEQSFRVENSISQSCNAYYCYIFRAILENPKYGGVKQGYEAWREYMLRLGFGRVLNTDFANELKGLIPSSDYYQKYVYRNARWRALPIISLSIGQGEIGITPLQMANHTALIANRGYYYIPHVVKEIEGQPIDVRFKTPVSSGIDSSWFRPVINGMEKVMQPGGTGAMSWVPGISV